MKESARRRKDETIASTKKTDEQKQDAQIGFFLEVAKTARVTAKETAGDLHLRGKARRRFVADMQSIFTNIYYNRSEDAGEVLSTDNGPDMASCYQDIVALKRDELDKKKHLAQQNALQLSVAQRTSIRANILLTLPTLTEDQKQTLFETTGYSPAEGKYIRKKLRRSAVGSFLTGNIGATTVIGAVGAHETVRPTLEYGLITEPKMALALGISYLTHYASIRLTAYTNRRLLEYPAVNNSTNFLATGLHFFAKRYWPENRKASRRAVTLGAFLPVMSQELGVVPASLAWPGVGIVRNAGGTIFNLGMSVGNFSYEGGMRLKEQYKKSQRYQETQKYKLSDRPKRVG